MQNSSLRKQIYDYLKDQLEKDLLRPGKMINQRELSNLLGVSRTPLRDTMIQLEAEGIVKIVPCRGIFIKAMTLQEIRDYFQMAGALEGKAYELALPFCTGKHLKEMENIIDEALVQLRKGVFSKCNSQNEKFNDIVIDLCPNKIISKTLSDIRQRLYHFPYTDPSLTAEREIRIWEEHGHIVELLRQNKKEELGSFISNVHWNMDDDYFRARFPYIADTE